jgi:hypothetical protein
MTWVRRDDQASIHRKVAPLDDATYRLWSEAMEWCSRNGTDGVIRADELSDVSKRGTRPRAVKLVERGLWHAAGDDCDSEKCTPPGPDGWAVHDYLDYNPPRAQVLAEKKAKAERTQRWRDKKRNGDASPGHHVTDTYPGGDASPSRPVPPRPEGGGGGAPVAPPAAVGGVAAASGESKPQRPCRTCGNALDSAYHRGPCLRSASTIGSP